MVAVTFPGAFTTAPLYATGANYDVGSVFIYLDTIWRVTTAITNAPATPPQGSINAIGRWMDQGLPNTATPVGQYQLAFGFNGDVTYPTFVFTTHSAGSLSGDLRIQVNDGVSAMAADATKYNFNITADGTATMRKGDGTRRFLFGANQLRIGPAGTGAVGTAGSPALVFGDDTDTGIYHSADGNIDFSSNATRRMNIAGAVNVYGGGLTMDAGNIRLDASGNSNDGGQVIQWRQDNAEVTGSIRTAQTGNIIGGNAEGTFYLETMNGGYGFKRVFNSTVNSPVQTQWDGALNAPAFTVTSSAAIKDAVQSLILPDIEDILLALQPRKFQWADQPTPVDENGVPLENPALPPAKQDVYGFIVEELAQVPALANILNTASIYDTAPSSYDLGQLLAVAMVGLQHQTRKVRRAMRRIRRLEEALGLPTPLDLATREDETDED